MCGSTCFGSLSDQHQERTTALGASVFTVGAGRLERFGRGQAGYYRPDHAQQRSNRHAPTVKPETPSALVRS
jgi:hypothetical protein